MCPAGVEEDDRHEHELTVGRGIGVAESLGIGGRDRQVHVVAAGARLGFDLLPQRLESTARSRTDRLCVDRPFHRDRADGVVGGETDGSRVVGGVTGLRCRPGRIVLFAAAACGSGIHRGTSRSTAMDLSVTLISPAWSAGIGWFLARAVRTAMKSRGALTQSAAMIWPLR